MRDVDAAYKVTLAAIRKDSPAPANTPGANLLPPTVGRVLTSNMNGTQPAQMTADIRAEIRTDQADAIMSAIKNSGEVLNASVTESPEQINVTRVKRGLVVRFINVAAVAPREVRQMRGISADVQKTYTSLLTTLQDLAAQGSVRVIGSAMHNADPHSISANFAFEVRRETIDAVQKAFDNAGVIFPSLNITRSTDTTNTLDSKVLFQIDEIRSAESMDPRRIITLAEEVENVDRARADLLKSLQAMPAGSVKEVDFSETRDQAGRVTAHWTLDTPMNRTFDVQNAIRNLGGIEKNNQETRNTQVPDTSLAKERIDLTLVSRQGIVQSDQGFGQTLRGPLLRRRRPALQRVPRPHRPPLRRPVPADRLAGVERYPPQEGDGKSIMFVVQPSGLRSTCPVPPSPKEPPMYARFILPAVIFLALATRPTLADRSTPWVEGTKVGDVVTARA